MQYYHGLTTQKSFDFLQDLNRRFDFILIGGWAVWLYTRALKSKDIDIIIDYPVLGKMREVYDVYKNDRLAKYEIKAGEFDIDIYLDHYSDLGVPLGEIVRNSTARGGFKVPRLEVLLFLKLYAWANRRGSAKGTKDELDIFALAFLPECDWQKYAVLAGKWRLEKYRDDFIGLLKSRTSVRELGINEQKMAKIRKGILTQMNFKL